MASDGPSERQSLLGAGGGGTRTQSLAVDSPSASGDARGGGRLRHRSAGGSRSRGASFNWLISGIKLDGDAINAEDVRRSSVDGEMVAREAAGAHASGAHGSGYVPALDTILASPQLARKPRGEALADAAEKGAGKGAAAEREDREESVDTRMVRLRSTSEEREDNTNELTLRSILVGNAVGFVVCISNIYFGLKTSLTLGSSFTGAILGFAALALADKFTRRENCSLTSACNAAGGFSAGYITAIPALMWLGKTFSLGQLILWTLSAGLLGVWLMPALRDHMVIQQELAFPSGTATAVVISKLHAAKTEGFAQAKALLYSMAAAFSYVILTYFVPFLYNFPLFTWLGLPAAQSAGFFVNFSPAIFGAGVFTGLKNCLVMSIAAVLAYGVLGPAFLCTGPNARDTAFVSGCADGGILRGTSGDHAAPTMPLMQEWWLWVSIAILFADQVVGIMLQYRSIGAAFGCFKRAEGSKPDPAPPEHIVPPKVWGVGLLASSALCVTVVTLYFDMEWWDVVIAIVFGIPLSVICIQCTGETDTTPTGAVGKMSQLLFAVLTPHAPIPNLMAANIAASGATQSTDVMQSFKTGHLLRASPKAQFWASVAGCLTGVVASITGWYLFKDLIPQCDPSLPNCESFAFPAQAALIWYKAAQVLSTGVSALPTHVLPFAAVGLGYGTLSAYLNRYLPPDKKKWFPSSIAISLGLLLGPYLPLAMLMGCLLDIVLKRRFPERHEEMGVPIASGMIAGEGLAGIVQGVFGLLNVRQGGITMAG
eukprot:CAMPEP_0203807002 /NCGR_PEP_ID=MMETSP0115-20131106/820_1 /ASSEMBLY_ACC=CAM_ASM_000227 /TAXON_ID=33651 /ORGANISM="Bicosoecid sp, Strain ms1" /LENGTH=768 /DNA_ID=CAMNT_0050715669 /DNA_START=41 /DNA_END=2343 /DNA_ORIENTATION=-